MKEKHEIIFKTPKIPKTITKEWLIKQLEKLNSKHDENIKCSLDYRKMYKLKHDYSYYIDMIYDTYNIDSFEPELEFCETDDQKDIWLFFRLKISSFECAEEKMRFRYIQILIRDKNTKKYVGVASLSSIYGSSFDKYIGWNKDVKLGLVNKKTDEQFYNCMMNHVLDISTCVGIPPFCFNYNGGKLVAMLMFSKEVYDYVLKKDNDELACIVTYSLYGKSIQYSRLKELKYIGLTKGDGVSHLPKWYHKCIKSFMNTNYPDTKYCDKLRRLSAFATKYGVKSLIKGIQRGMYIGFTGKNTLDFLCGIDDKFIVNNLESVNDIGNRWKQSYATIRFDNLIKTNRVMLSNEYDASVIDEKDYNRLKHSKKKNNDNKKEKLTYNQKIQIIEYYIKNKEKSMLQMELYFTEKFGKPVGRRIISNFLKK
jgi:hypothetical protein